MTTTPFILAYGMEAIIPTKIGMPTAKIAVQDQMDNDEELIRQLDWADEMRGDETIWIASYHQRTITQYKKKGTTMIFSARIFSPQKNIREHSWSRIRKGTS